MSNQVASGSWFPRFYVSRTTHGGPPLMQKMPTAASQTILKGDPLTISGGEVSKGASNSGSIYGVAAEDVTTTAADEKTEVNIWLADRTNIFCAQGNAASSGINEGSACDIVSSGSKWLLHLDSTTESVALVVDHIDGDSESDGTYFGRLEFVWHRSSYDALVAAL